MQCFICKGFGHVSRIYPSQETQYEDQVVQRERKRGRSCGPGEKGLDEKVITKYAQEFSLLSLYAVCISSVTGPSRKRFIEFCFHDLKDRSNKDDDLKVDAAA